MYKIISKSPKHYIRLFKYSKYPRIKAIQESSISTNAEINQKFKFLKDWIKKGGGFVHDELKLEKSADYNRIVLKAKRDILGDEMSKPCLAIPQTMIMSRITILNELDSEIINKSKLPLENLHPQDLIALYLAHERKKQTKSRWWPGIQSLPEKPLNPWLKSIKEINEIFYDDEIKKLIKKERDGVELESRRLSHIHGINFNIDAMDILWALAQVQAITILDRSGEPFWAPLINFTNLDIKAPSPFAEGKNNILYALWGWPNEKIKEGQEIHMNYGIKDPILVFFGHNIVLENL